MRNLLPLVVLAAAACYSPRPVTTPGPYSGGSLDDLYTPLEATLWFDEYTGTAHFDVTRPAHVAIFAFRPNGGMDMIYPAYGRGLQSRFVSGRHLVRTRGASYRHAGGWSTVYGASPTYIILIASEERLDVNRFLPFQRASYSVAPFVHASPYMAVDMLAERIVPNQAAQENWTYAMQVVWPQDAWPDRSRARWYVNVACPNGVILTVPADAYRRGWVRCPDNTETGEPTPSDSTGGLREALPTRPSAPGARGEVGVEAERGSVTDGLPRRPAGPGLGDGAKRGGVLIEAPRRPPTPPGWIAGRGALEDDGDDEGLGEVIRGIRSVRGIGEADRGDRGVISVPVRSRSPLDWRDQIRDRAPEFDRTPRATRPGSVVRGWDRPARVKPRSSRPVVRSKPASRPAVKSPPPRRPPPKPRPPKKDKPPKGSGGGTG